MDNLKIKSISKEIKLPSNIEAEQALIGSVLVNNDIIDEIASITNEKEFHDPLHSKIYEFIEKLPDKYKTLIGENAIRLSGGQKQRISIARAILKNSPIILLDEATSSLDAESEEKVQNAIFNLTKNKTTLVIAHRLSTINKANKIILMKDGEVLKSGTHNELLKNSPEYESLYRKQILNFRFSTFVAEYIEKIMKKL